ncbi:MAG TPA: serine hydrolase, partial [Cellvibrionaceae bacterium]
MGNLIGNITCLWRCFAIVCFAILLLSLPASVWALDVEVKTQVVAAGERLPRLHSVLLAHEGEVVFEHTFAGPGPDVPVNIKSLSKTVMAALVGAAIERGVITRVEQPIVDLLGERVPGNATDGVKDITVGHLLSLQAGLQRTSGRFYGAWVTSDNWVDYILTRPFVDKPGGTMLYSTGSTHLLSAALTEAAGESTLSLARKWLGEPL